MKEHGGRTVVVGAGVVGVCAAYELAARGAPVMLIDAGEVGVGCSFGNAGLISLGHLPIPRPGVVRQALRWMFDPASPLYIAPRFDPSLPEWLWRFNLACSRARLERNMKTLAELSHKTVGLFEAIEERSRAAGRPFFYAPRGYMEIYRTPEALAHARAHADLTRRCGFDSEILTGAELHAREPALSDALAGAVWYSGSAFCNPHDFVRATAALARDCGAEIIENSPVARVVVRDGAAAGVELEDGRFVEGSVVALAAGSWTPPLARAVGVRLLIQPAKGYHRDVAMGDPPLRTACILGEANMVCTPMEGGEGFLRLAGTLEFSGMNSAMRPRRLEMLSEQAGRYLTSPVSGEVRSEWMGLRPCTPDGLPVIGWAPKVRGVFIATGHAMLGLSQGPATGKIVAECVLDGKTDIDLGPMRPDRF